MFTFISIHCLDFTSKLEVWSHLEAKFQRQPALSASLSLQSIICLLHLFTVIFYLHIYKMLQIKQKCKRFFSDPTSSFCQTIQVSHLPDLAMLSGLDSGVLLNIYCPMQNFFSSGNRGIVSRIFEYLSPQPNHGRDYLDSHYQSVDLGEIGGGGAMCHMSSKLGRRTGCFYLDCSKRARGQDEAPRPIDTRIGTRS